MIEYNEKETKKFLSKFSKMINNFLKYNIEPVILLQIGVKDNVIHPVIYTKKMGVDVFQYLKILCKEDEVAARNLEYFPFNEIKTLRDNSYYSPILISTFHPIPLFTIELKDLKSKEYILPLFSENAIKFDFSNFIVVDLLKNALKTLKIAKINSFLELFDDENLRYDSSLYLYRNTSKDAFKSIDTEKLSPSHLFPLSLENDEQKFLSKTFKKILINLNSTLINLEIKEFIITDNRVLLLKEEEISDLLNNVESKKDYMINGIKATVYKEFIHLKPKKILITAEYVFSDSLNSTNVGLVLQYSDFITYVFYKYFHE